MPETVITQEALTRSETTTRRELRAEVRSIAIQLKEVRRRLDDLNNSHEKAAEEKRRTDAAATRIQETAATKDDVRKLERDVLARLDVTAGATAAQAKVWSIVTGIGGGLIVGLILRFFS